MWFRSLVAMTSKENNKQGVWNSTYVYLFYIYICMKHVVAKGRLNHFWCIFWASSATFFKKKIEIGLHPWKILHITTTPSSTLLLKNQCMFFITIWEKIPLEIKRPDSNYWRSIKKGTYTISACGVITLCLHHLDMMFKKTKKNFESIIKKSKDKKSFNVPEAMHLCKYGPKSKQ